MKIRPSKTAFGVLLSGFALCALAVCAGVLQGQTPKVMAMSAWAGPPLAPQNNTAVYMTINNPSTEPVSVVSVTTKDAAGAELHETKMDGKMMMMTPIKSLVVPAKGSVELKQGGYHIMLTGVKKPLKPGDKLKLALKLDNGKSIPVTVDIKALAAGQGMPMPSTTPEQH